MKISSLVVTAVVFLVIACNREKNNEPDTAACPIISSDSVPMLVKDSFTQRYTSDSVITWFRKDSIGYCAYFIPSTGQKTLAEFGNSGNFIMQMIESGGDNESEDSTATGGTKGGTTGCECEIPED